eukprot:Tbor_TRINITY_DN5167_c0_g1::TRINITY_DN5167_c0_g1_i2::g.25773::m.25773
MASSGTGIIFFQLWDGNHPSVQDRPKGQVSFSGNKISANEVKEKIAEKYGIHLSKFEMILFNEKTMKLVEEGDTMLPSYSSVRVTVKSIQLTDVENENKRSSKNDHRFEVVIGASIGIGSVSTAIKDPLNNELTIERLGNVTQHRFPLFPNLFKGGDNRGISDGLEVSPSSEHCLLCHMKCLSPIVTECCTIKVCRQCYIYSMENLMDEKDRCPMCGSSCKEKTVKERYMDALDNIKRDINEGDGFIDKIDGYVKGDPNTIGVKRERSIDINDYHRRRSISSSSSSSSDCSDSLSVSGGGNCLKF